MANFWERFMKWQNAVHYLLLTTGLSYVAYYYGAPFDANMFLALLGSIIILDTAIHFTFSVLPKPFKWED